uniref:Uncharacterized protein n=1 Tax=Tanacetum cinerariifolium TaxID=118510 RepID=A0A6L2NC71_TANCI|nr:hypothetical protein [Tanacetum cinerariifolium]
MDVQAPTTMAPLTLSAPTLTPLTIATISIVPQAPTPPTTASSTLLQDLPNFGSLFGFDHRLKTLEANFSKFMQTSQFAGAVSSIPKIVQRYMDQQMNEAVKVAVLIQSDRLRDKVQAKNEEFLKNIDENIQKIIKEQVKEQVKVQVSKILPKIKKTVNEKLEAAVLTWSSNSSNTSYAVAADLSKMELKKILIEKMEGNKSIHPSDEQRNLYKALVEAYESNKIIWDTYRDIVTLKRRRDDDADKGEKPSVGSDQGSKRRREGKEPESTSEEPMQTTHDLEESSHQEFVKGVVDDQPIAEASQHPEWFQQQKKPPTPDRDWNKTLPATHESIQPWISELAKQADSRSSFNDLMATLVDFLAFLTNRLKVDTLTPELLAGLTYELMKGSCKSLMELEFFLEEVYKATTDQGCQVIPFDYFINNDLEYLRGSAYSRKYTTSVTKTKAADYVHIKWIEALVPRTIIIAVTKLQIVEWHNYKHLDWITNVHEKHRNPKACGRPSTRCRKLPEEAQPHKARYIPFRFKADGTLNDVRTVLDDRLKGIQMKYLPQTIWRKSDKERAATMIQAIYKHVNTSKPTLWVV